MRLMKFIKHNCKKAVAFTMATIMALGSVSGLVKPVSAAFPAAKAGKTATVSFSTVYRSSALSYVGTSSLENIVLTSGSDKRCCRLEK